MLIRLRQRRDSKACELDASLWSIGTVYMSEDRPIVRNFERGITYMQKGCDAGFMDVCSSLGSYYIFVPEIQNYTRAKDLFKKSCDGDWFEGCSQLITIHQDGLGVKKDVAKVRKYQRRTRALVKDSCEKGEQSSCDFLKEFDTVYPPVERRTRFQFPVEKNEEGASKWESCNQEDYAACDWLVAACTEGDAMACLRAGWATSIAFQKERIVSKRL